jgi:hypothetical protein
VPKRVLQYNLHAKADFTRHEICWGADSDDSSIRDWATAIRGGDSIQIIPKAQWPAWINFVQEAEIEVHGSDEIPPLAMVSTPSTASVSDCYRPLDKSLHEIRLIILKGGIEDEPLSCFLVYTSLEQSPAVSYEALSYCWGDPRMKRDIFVKVRDQEEGWEHAISITLALHTALKRLRPPQGEVRTLWIDAICINQDNLDERASQVSMMREIYRNASRVIVWLGDGTDATQRSIETVKAICHRYNSLNPISGTEISSKDDIDQLHEPMSERYVAAHYFVDHWSVFEFSWFRRTWVVQEIYNARSAIVHCGTDVLTWPTVLRVNRCMGMVPMKANSAHKAFMPPIFEVLFDSRIETDKEWSCNTSILDVLLKGLDLDATDPRDKIFAMLQFGRETGQLDKLPSDVAIDYRRPVKEVFARFTRWWIVEHKSLTILSAIQALEGRTWQQINLDRDEDITSGLPTWSWSYRGHSNWAVGILGLPPSAPYNAAGTTVPETVFITTSTSWRTLCLSGLRVGTITNIFPYPYFQPPKEHESLHRAYIAIFDPLNLTGKWSDQLHSHRTKTYVMNDDKELMRGHSNAHYESTRRTASLECHSDCFMRTDKDGIGLCTSGTRPGDLVVVLYGGNVPYVLRERNQSGSEGTDDKRWEFVGECYLEGYMHGRAIQEQRDKGKASEVFVLI